MSRKTLLIVACAAVLSSRDARATLVNLGPGSFTPQAPVITFDEVPLGTTNPSIPKLNTPDLGDVTVSFAGAFVGQTVSGGFPVTLVDHIPSSPLTLDLLSPATVTVNDGAPGATSPVLSGTPTFNGPISVLFSKPVAGVALKGGYFDAVNSTTIEAYDANGNSLGTITNSVTGFEFYGLADSSGGEVIKGVSFYITGNEPAGFEIDDVTFGAASVINITPAAAPAVSPRGMILLSLLLAATGWLVLWRQRLHGTEPL